MFLSFNQNRYGNALSIEQRADYSFLLSISHQNDNKIAEGEVLHKLIQSPLLARLLIVMGLLLPLTPLVRVLYQRLFLLFIIGGIYAFVHFMQNASDKERMRWCKVLAWIGSIGVAAWTVASIFLMKQGALITSLQQRIVNEGTGSSFGYFRNWLEMRAINFTDDLLIWSPQQSWPLILLALAIIGLGLSAAKKPILEHSDHG